MGHKYAWDRKVPRRDEQRHAQPETGGHRPRKNVKRWCRGKVGVEHTSETVIAAAGWQRFAGWADRSCGWARWLPDDVWICRHQEVCTGCGKILRENFSKDCPDYQPR